MLSLSTRTKKRAKDASESGASVARGAGAASTAPGPGGHGSGAAETSVTNVGRANSKLSHVSHKLQGFFSFFAHFFGKKRQNPAGTARRRCGRNRSSRVFHGRIPSWRRRRRAPGDRPRPPPGFVGRARKPALLTRRINGLEGSLAVGRGAHRSSLPCCNNQYARCSSSHTDPTP